MLHILMVNLYSKTSKRPPANREHKGQVWSVRPEDERKQRSEGTRQMEEDEDQFCQIEINIDIFFMGGKIHFESSNDVTYWNLEKYGFDCKIKG